MTRNVHVLVEKFYYLNSRYRLKVGPFTPFGKPFQEIFMRNIFCTHEHFNVQGILIVDQWTFTFISAKHLTQTKIGSPLSTSSQNKTDPERSLSQSMVTS